MTWDDDSTAAQREWEKQKRREQAAWDREHPPPRRGRRPGMWVTPAWTGPDSPQGPVWVTDLKPWQGTLI